MKTSTNIKPHWLINQWMLVFSLFWGLVVGLPFLAPLLMQVGLVNAGNLIYKIYSTLCHQLPQRSFFLFGEKTMYALTEIQTFVGETNNPMELRTFNGNSALGWKVAWSDRMVSMYTSILVFGVIWWLLRRNLKPLRWWGLLIFILLLAVDGASHQQLTAI